MNDDLTMSEFALEVAELERAIYGLFTGFFERTKVSPTGITCTVTQTAEGIGNRLSVSFQGNSFYNYHPDNKEI